VGFTAEEAERRERVNAGERWGDIERRDEDRRHEMIQPVNKI